MQRSSNIWPRSSLGCLTALLGLALLGACAPEAQWIEQRRFAMGTWVDTLYRAPEPAVRARVDNDLDNLLGRFAIDYYAWADGELAQLNAALRSGNEFTASPALAALLERARNLSRRSEGFFEPGVGVLVETWGFHSAQAEPSEPGAEFLADWQHDPPSIDDLRIDGAQLRTQRDDLLIDLGGIAKGAVVDELLAAAVAAGLSDVLVNAGGDVRVRGSRGERPWTVGIQSPRSAALLGSIALEDGEAVFTSGDYERYFDSDDGRRHHLLDPATGLPATHTQAVTVIADNGTLADAAATALFVAGPQHWRRIAAALDIDYVLRVGAGGAIEMTPAMRERVHMQVNEEPVTIPVQNQPAGR